MGGIALDALKQIIIMFLLIVTGIICYKIKLIDENTSKKLSDLVLFLITPFVIIVSYQRKFETRLLTGLLISMALAVVTLAVSIVLSKLVICGKNNKENIPVERFAAIYSNCGFIGIPLAYGVFGSESVFYVTAYLTVFNLCVWTHGVILMTGKKNLKTFLKALLSPTIIVIFVSFILFIARVNFPDILEESFNYIASMNTPLAMLVSGVFIAQTDFKKIFTNYRIYYVALIKLLVIPLIVLLIFSRFHIPREVLLTSVLITSCPTAAAINLFSLHYGKDYIYASELFTISTVLSVITIPLVMMAADFIV